MLPKSLDRYGWFQYYEQRFNKTEEEQAAIAAMWYLFLHLALDDEVNPALKDPEIKKVSKLPESIQVNTDGFIPIDIPTLYSRIRSVSQSLNVLR